MIEFKLPSLGADMDEGKLLEWRIAPGQQIRKGDVVAVVDTSKAAVDVESWESGTVHELLTQPGETIPVGTVMAILLADGEAAPAPAPTTKGAKEAKAVPAGKAEKAKKAEKGRSEREPELPSQELPPAAPPASPARLRVSPAARQLARERGVDVASLTGSGPDGAVTRDDVEAAARRVQAPADRRAEMRKSIAAAMSRSKREIPHYYLAEDIPMRQALAWLQARNQSLPVTARLLPAALMLKAVALALREFPEMNGLCVDGEFTPSPAAHVGVAIALRQGGLVAPAVHGVGDLALPDLMRALSDLVTRCRAGSLRSSEMADPTITVTNLGDQGVASVFGVIYPPQVALVGFGRVADRAWVEAGSVTVMPVVTASLAADHRVSDGHRGALFLARIGALLQQPGQL